MKESNIPELMIELLEDKNVDIRAGTVTERGMQIIDEISGYAKEFNDFKLEKHLIEYLKALDVPHLWAFMSYTLSDASTTLHRDMCVVTIMPFIKRKLDVRGK